MALSYVVLESLIHFSWPVGLFSRFVWIVINEQIQKGITESVAFIA